MEAIKLTFPADMPPLSVIVALSLSSSPVTIDSSPAATVPTLVFSDGRKLSGASVLLRYVGRSASSLPGFYNRDAFESSKIDEWVDYAHVFSSGSEFEKACSRVDNCLAHSAAAFLVGNSLSIADVAIWSALTGSGLRWESLRKSKKYENLVRWFNSILLDYAEPLNKVATYTTTTVKKGSGKPAPRSKEPSI